MKRNMMDVTITEASCANIPVIVFCKSTMDQTDQINESTELVSLCRRYGGTSKRDLEAEALVTLANCDFTPLFDVNANLMTAWTRRADLLLKAMFTPLTGAAVPH